jgi:hypothetical protein
MVFYMQYYTEPSAKIVYYCSYRPQPLGEGQRPALAEPDVAGARPLGCAGLGPAVTGCADTFEAVRSAAPTGAEAPDGLISPEAAVTGPLASPTRQSHRLG